MNKIYRTELEVDPHPEFHQGIERTVIGAVVVIESSDEGLHNDLVNAIAVVEAVRRNKL